MDDLVRYIRYLSIGVSLEISTKSSGFGSVTLTYRILRSILSLTSVFSRLKLAYANTSAI